LPLLTVLPCGITGRVAEGLADSPLFILVCLVSRSWRHWH